MIKKFRHGEINDEVFTSDSLSGMQFDSEKAESHKLYYTEYDGDLFVVIKKDDGMIEFGMVEEEET